MGDIRGLAYGVLRMSRADFMDMPVGEFWEAVEAHYKEVEADRRHVGELVRGAALRLFNINLKRGDQIRDPRKFWPMPWDEEAEAVKETGGLESMTEEERTASARSLLERIGWRKNDGRE